MIAVKFLEDMFNFIAFESAGKLTD